MINEQWLMLGTIRGVGTVSVDGASLRGEGGASNPQLVVPLNVRMSNQPREAMLALVRVRAWLGTEQHVWPGNALCPPAIEDLLASFPVRSLPEGQNSDQVQLRFFLTPHQIEELERRRHAAPGDTSALYLRLEPVVVGLRTFKEMVPGQVPQSGNWAQHFGLYSDLAVFWTASVSPIQIEVELSSWLRTVLPGLGYDTIRLLDVRLPPPLPDSPSAGAEFDKARRALDAHRYEECVAACRGLLGMWERELDATKDRRVAQVLAERRGLSEDDPRRWFVDALWKASRDVVSTAHHPEGTSAEFQASDARLILLLTAALSEYVASAR